ncbi:MAG: recombination mediator RecR [Deltaproteobacteria bacterium]|nr:recombination mediator RecR [Myxococcales bacterium]MDP3215875.1 recombination mediator RecR [Deltaproteobacteria bacterium]
MSDEGDPIHSLVRLLTRLPGVGEKSARRIAYHVLGADPDYARALGETIATLSERVRRCASCGAYTSRVRCAICDDPRRTSELLCVVARPMDADAVERARVFQGRYHILHALLDPLGGVGPGEFPLQPLLDRVAREGVREVILATPPTVEGEATALYLAECFHAEGVAVTRIASGVPHGGELEFTDPITLGRAMEGRRTV